MPIASARAPFLFDGPVRRAIHRLKFSGWRPVAEALGAAMVAVFAAHAEVVTWVPVSDRRRAARGYDQARMLARVVAGRVDLPLEPLLHRVADPPRSQARTGGADRRVAMRGLFEPAGEVPRRIVLVDDVLTTGATAGACAEQLVAAGARDVSLLTAARAASGAMADLYSRRGLVSGSVVARGEVPR